MHRVIILGFPLLLGLAGVKGGERKLKGICEAVLDGDTIVVNRQRIRLLSIDAPELSQKSLDKKPIGIMSKIALSNLILGKKVFVTYSSRDRYKRVLGRVSYNKLDIGKWMLKNGFAVVYRGSVEEKMLEYSAKLKRRGIFAFDGFYAPSVYRKISKGL